MRGFYVGHQPHGSGKKMAENLKHSIPSPWWKSVDNREIHRAIQLKKITEAVKMSKHKTTWES